MGFKEHPDLRPPPNKDAIIWRYMDLAKFLSILEKSALHFAQVDKLAELDPFEGYFPFANVLAEKFKFEQTSEEWRIRNNLRNEAAFNEIIENHKQIREITKGERQGIFINSWHVQEYESAAMWNFYVKSLEGIAIQSTYDRLKRSLCKCTDFEIVIGMMKYIDYWREAIPLGNLFYPFVHKRKSFEHEKELRALIWVPQKGKGKPANTTETGLYVNVDLDVLIDRIYLAPTAPSWMTSLLTSVVEKFGLQKKVIRSDLASLPEYEAH